MNAGWVGAAVFKLDVQLLYVELNSKVVWGTTGRCDVVTLIGLIRQLDRLRKLRQCDM
jgi:hypothetical protein